MQEGESSVESPRSRRKRLPAFLADIFERSRAGRRLVGHVRKRIAFYREAYSLSLTLALVLVLKFTVLMGFYIPSTSMAGTLQINDRIFVNRLAYLTGEPEVGDIVVFRALENNPYYDPEKPVWIKRVVATGGDRLSVRDNRLYVNGEPLSDPPIFLHNSYFPQGLLSREGRELIVPEGHVMVFGDNSANSCDSRYWGPLPEERIIGRAYVRYWPLDRIGPIHGESLCPLPGVHRNPS